MSNQFFSRSILNSPYDYPCQYWNLYETGHSTGKIICHYNEVVLFVRHAFFFGAKNLYKFLKTTLKAEIDANAWATLNNGSSNPDDKHVSGRISVKVISHLGLRR
jgi:hypothetical protein